MISWSLRVPGSSLLTLTTNGPRSRQISDRMVAIEVRKVDEPLIVFPTSLVHNALLMTARETSTTNYPEGAGLDNLNDPF